MSFWPCSRKGFTLAVEWRENFVRLRLHPLKVWNRRSRNGVSKLPGSSQRHSTGCHAEADPQPALQPGALRKAPMDTAIRGVAPCREIPLVYWNLRPGIHEGCPADRPYPTSGFGGRRASTSSVKANFDIEASGPCIERRVFRRQSPRSGRGGGRLAFRRESNDLEPIVAQGLNHTA